MKITKLNWNHFGRIFLFLAFLFCLQIVSGYLVLRTYSFSQTKTTLTTLAARIKNDLKYQNGTWDTRLYAADPYTPHPTGSSGFTAPLYILTTDGFVIERNQPINGFLDDSDFKHLLTFSNPQTIRTVTNEQWRVLSRPIVSNHKTIGVITTAYYNPSDTILADIDNKLSSSIGTLSKEVTVHGNTISARHIDIRSVPYDISFEIVTSYNKVVANNGRTPSFIDPSYVASVLSFGNTTKMIKDSVNNENYEVYFETLYDSEHNPIAVIVAGESLTSLYHLLTIYLLYSSVLAIFIIIPLTALTAYVLRRDVFSLFGTGDKNRKIKKNPSFLSFHKKESTLTIDNSTIEIPYSSNQYFLCEAVFSAPKKRWEQDELLERFGEDVSAANSRKVYDAMLAVNKKVNLKVITYQDKTYRLNPEFLSAVA